MRLRSLRIHDFRSIKDIELICTPLTTLIGPNNHGKSNILKALEFGLSPSLKPSEQDFFALRESGDDTLWVELTFQELTEQEKRVFEKYLLSDDTVCIRKTAQLREGKIEIAYNGYFEIPEADWLNPDRAREYTSRENINNTLLKSYVPESGRLTTEIIQEAQKKFIAEHKHELKIIKQLESAALLGQKNVAGGILPDFFLIPAVSELSDETQVKNTTAFGRLLMRTVREMAEHDTNLTQAYANIRQAIQSLNEREKRSESKSALAQLEELIMEGMGLWDTKVTIELEPPEIGKLFELGTKIYLDDGVKTDPVRKGHGIQRTMIFSLFQVWANLLMQDKIAKSEDIPNSRSQSGSIIFAVEEPELFLHPHAQRKLYKSLREITNYPDHQIFLCTHSPHFISLDHPEEIAIVAKQSVEKGSYVRQCTKELFKGEDFRERKNRFNMVHWITPERAEMFFAKKVVFVEGETEKVVFPFLAQKIGVYDPEISFVNCGSKFNLPLYIEIANAFDIPYVVIHDEDPLPDSLEGLDSNEREQKQKTYDLNNQISNLVKSSLGRIEMCCPDFEGVAAVPNSQVKKKGKPLAALEHFESTDENNTPIRFKEIITTIFQS
ncbi:MAG: AAA family ATPase [Anaerolineae bacterium]|nr:AAA family ATPase [Anaerolineae bacterium]